MGRLQGAVKYFGDRRIDCQERQPAHATSGQTAFARPRLVVKSDA